MQRIGFSALIVVAAVSNSAGSRASDDKNAITAWGKPVADLQAGIRCSKGMETIALGRTTELTIVIRNVARKPVDVVRYTTPMVAFARLQGSTVAVTLVPRPMNELMVEKKRLEPGEVLAVATVSVSHVQPGREKPSQTCEIRLPAGCYHVGSDEVGHALFNWRAVAPDSGSDERRKPKLATGYLDVELLSEKQKQQQKLLRPVGWSEGSGYAWRGVFAAEGKGAKRQVFLYNPKDKSERIQVGPNWTAFVLKEWATYEGIEVEANSWQNRAPLEFYLLVPPEKTQPKAKQLEERHLSADDWVPLYEMSAKIDLAVSPKRYYHGPTLVVAANGDWLLAFQDSTSNSGHDGVVTQMRSSDQGKTWRRDGIVFDQRNQGRFGRNPLYGLTDDGVIVLIVNLFMPERKPLPGDPHRAMTVDSVWLSSTDNGKTYRDHGRVLREPRIRFTQATGTRLVTLNNKLLVAGRQHSPRLEECGIWLYVLNDLQKGWQRGPLLFPFKDKNAEIIYPALVYHKDVGLRAYVVTNDKTGRLGEVRERISKDGGQTWSEIATVPSLRVANNPEMTYAGDVLLCTARGQDRASVVLYFSPDHGRHWGHPIVLDRYGPRSPDGAYTGSVPHGKDGVFIAFASDGLYHRMPDIRAVYLTKVRIRSKAATK